MSWSEVRDLEQIENIEKYQVEYLKSIGDYHFLFAIYHTLINSITDEAVIILSWDGFAIGQNDRSSELFGMNSLENVTRIFFLGGKHWKFKTRSGGNIEFDDSPLKRAQNGEAFQNCIVEVELKTDFPLVENKKHEGLWSWSNYPYFTKSGKFACSVLKIKPIVEIRKLDQ